MPKLYHKRHKNDFYSIIKGMKKVLAVSGGIDSVVMLHLLKDEQPIVAHFDHGIRPNSREDAEFVERLANKYGLQFEVARMELGEGCSEADAREKRYLFLEEIAEKNNATICVAHHADDVLGSIVINIIRGTGWRGLAPMSASDIERPLLGWHKSDIYRYSAEHELVFRQDQTNTEGNYLRNRVREKLMDLSEESKGKLIELYEKQVQLSSDIQEQLADILGDGDSCYVSKELINDSPLECAMEIMRDFLKRNEISLTRPQLEKCIEAAKNYLPGKRLSLDRKHFLEVGKYSLRVI